MITASSGPLILRQIPLAAAVSVGSAEKKPGRNKCREALGSINCPCLLSSTQVNYCSARWQRNLAASQRHRNTGCTQQRLPSGAPCTGTPCRSCFTVSISPAQSAFISSGKGREAANKQTKTSATEFTHPSQKSKQVPSFPLKVPFLHLFCLQKSLKEKQAGHVRPGRLRSKRLQQAASAPAAAQRFPLPHACPRNCEWLLLYARLHSEKLTHG